MQHLATLGRRPDIHTHKVSRDNLLAMVAAGHGLTITSEATTGAQMSGIVYRQIRGESLPFSAAWSPQNDNPACRRPLSMARTMAGNT